MIFKLAIRNLIRNRRRSLLTSLMIVAGFVVMSFSLGLSEGGYDRIIELFTDMKTGHVQVLHPEYLQDPTLYKTVSKVDAKIEQIKQVAGVKAVGSRVDGGGLASFAKQTVGVQVVGVDVQAEPNISTLKERISQGHWFEKSNNYEVVIGASVAKRLKAGLGDKIALISQAADGSISNDYFQVVGLIKSNSVDDYIMYTDLKSAQEYFSLWGQAHRIVIVGDGFASGSVLKEKISKILTAGEGRQDLIASWDEVEAEFVAVMVADKSGNIILYLIIGFVVGLGVLNTVLMSLLERKREFGILRAIGTRPLFLFRMIMAETLFLTLLSSIAAVLISYLLNWRFSIEGIKFSTPIEFGGMMINEMVSTTDLVAFSVPFLVVLISAMSVAIIPAVKAARTSPSHGMRAR